MGEIRSLGIKPKNTTELTDKSFTGHEQIDEIDGLIHMGGRVYDSAIGRFLSADIHVPHPHSTQSYNRYSYVRNNPLGFVDPSGYSDVALTMGTTIFTEPSEGQVKQDTTPTNGTIISITGSNIPTPVNQMYQKSYIHPGLLAATGSEALASDGTVYHNIDYDETDAAFEKFTYVFGGLAVGRSIVKNRGSKLIGDFGRSLGIKTTMGLTREGLGTYYAKHLLKDGKIFAKDFKSLIPKNVKNTWKPSERTTLGAKYKFKVNEINVEFKIHSPDKGARIKHPSSNSGSQWTAQIKIGKKLLGTDGKLYNKPSNLTHILFRMK